MASYAYIVPSLSGIPGVNFYNMGSLTATQNAIWRRGDYLALTTTGTIVHPNPNGALATITPTVIPTLGTTVLATAPAQYYYAYYTVTTAGVESLPSAEFVIPVLPGFEATVNVPAAGAPAGATGYSLYVGLLPGYEVQQGTAATALGTPTTILYPLANYQGATRAATNASTNIVGMATDDFDITYAPSIPNAAQFGSRSLFGVDVTDPPTGFYEQYQGFFIKASNQTFEMNLVQAWYPSLINSTAGLLYSTTYDTFAADNSQTNKILTIVDKVYGSFNPGYGEPVGQQGDLGARVKVRFNSGFVSL